MDDLTPLEMFINTAEQREALREIRRQRSKAIATVGMTEATPVQMEGGVP